MAVAIIGARRKGQVFTRPSSFHRQCACNSSLAHPENTIGYACTETVRSQPVAG